MNLIFGNSKLCIEDLSRVRYNEKSCKTGSSDIDRTGSTTHSIQDRILGQVVNGSSLPYAPNATP